MRRTITAIIMAIALLHAPCWAQDQTLLTDQSAKDSYSLGYDFGSNVKRQGVKIDLDLLLSAVRDALESKPPQLAAEEIQHHLLELRRKLMIRLEALSRQYADQNLAEGKTFLEVNKSQEGVQTLPSGLQYRVIREGSGPSPSPDDWVTVHYRGTLIDGREFDSSYERGAPATLPFGSMIDGWQAALPLMKTGAKWQVFVPSELAYGKRQSERIPPNSTLIFDLELLGISAPPAPEAAESPVTEDGPQS